jgi:PKD repeat protein
VPNTSTDLFCSSHSFLPNGDLVVAGGHLEIDGGAKDGNIYRWNTGTAGTWTKTEPMRAGRWYPSSATLANGEMVVVGGNEENHALNLYPEVWTGTGWRLLAGAPLQMPWYPFVFAAPNGQMFLAGPDPMSRYLNASGSGAWTNVASSVRGVSRDRGSAVMYQPGKVLMVGGGDPPTNTAEVIDLNGAAPAWQATGSMAYPRRHMNAVMLADGKVLALGGTQGPGYDDSQGVLPTELWDPATGAWRTLASMAVRRSYHSTAMLLPDGRVISAGSGRCPGCPTTDQPNAQIFSPPYLFNADGSPAARPTITGLPTPAVAHGQTFVVQTPNAADVARVTLVRLPSVTHSFDMNQRFNEVSFARGTGAVTVTAPANPYLAPAGHYMLFVLNAAGVPSEAVVVQITGTTALPALPTPAAPSALAVQRPGNTGTATLAWADNAGSETGYHVERCAGAGCSAYVEIAALPVNTTRYQDAAITNGVVYDYRVRARNSSGPSGYSNVASTAPAGGTAGNQAPTAAFTYRCDLLVCSFTDASTDVDGTVASRQWAFGDGTSSTNSNPVRTFAGSGTYTVSLTVTDNGGAKSLTASQNVSVAALRLTATGSKAKGVHSVDLTWSPINAAERVRITRNDQVISFNSPHNGAYRDEVGTKGGGVTYTYKVCVGTAGETARCSNLASVTF